METYSCIVPSTNQTPSLGTVGRPGAESRLGSPGGTHEIECNYAVAQCHFPDSRRPPLSGPACIYRSVQGFAWR